MKILITGTSSGIGRALAIHLAHARHQIWGLARRDQKDFDTESAAKNLSVRSSICDVSNFQAVDHIAQLVAQTWQRLDALICCAAVQGPIGPTMTIDPTQWTQSIAINLHGTFFCLRAFHPLLLRAQRRAKIICFSGGGATSPRPNFSAYASSKTALVRLVENLAHEWHDLPIDINAIAPGPVDTQMTEQVLALGPALAGEKEYRTALEQRNKGATPAEKYLGLASFLLGPESDGISGKLLSAVWDPWPQLPQHKDQLKSSDLYTLRRIVPEDRPKSQ